MTRVTWVYRCGLERGRDTEWAACLDGGCGDEEMNAGKGGVSICVHLRPAALAWSMSTTCTCTSAWRARPWLAADLASFGILRWRWVSWHGDSDWHRWISTVLVVMIPNRFPSHLQCRVECCLTSYAQAYSGPG